MALLICHFLRHRARVGTGVGHLDSHTQPQGLADRVPPHIHTCPQRGDLFSFVLPSPSLISPPPLLPFHLLSSFLDILPLMCLSQACEKDLTFRCSGDPRERGICRVEGASVSPQLCTGDPELDTGRRGHRAAPDCSRMMLFKGIAHFSLRGVF